MKQEVERIRNKILSLDFDFDDIDFVYLEELIELKHLFIVTLSNNKVTLNDKVVDYILNRILAVNSVPSGKFMYNFLDAIIDGKYFDYEIVLDICNSFIKDPEEISELMIKMMKKYKIKEKDLIENFTKTVISIKHLLDNDDYDVIMKLDASRILTKEEISLLLEEFPFSQLGVPPVCNSSIVKFIDYAEHMNLKQLGLLWVEFYKNNKDDIYALKKLYACIVKKVNSVEDFGEMVNFQEFCNSFAFLVYNEAYMFRNSFKELRDKGFYFLNTLADYAEIGMLGYIENISWDEKLELKSSEYKKIKESLEKSDKLCDYVKTLICSFNCESFFKDKELIELFKKYKRYDILVLYYFDINDDLRDFFREAIKNHDVGIRAVANDIISKIDFTSWHKNKRDTSKFLFISHNYSLLLRNNMLDKIIIAPLFLEYKSKVDALCDYINANPNVKIEFQMPMGDKIQDLGLAKAMLTFKRYDNFLKYVYIESEFLPIVLEEIDASPMFRYELTKYPNIVFKNEEIFYRVISHDDISAVKMLELLNHNDEYRNLYNEKTYECFKGIIAYKYGYDFEKLDYVASKLGYIILKYLDNENIKRLLSFSLDDINKIFNLFPDVEFTRIDLEAAYDAIKQYEFSFEREGIINVFPLILHLIEDGNEEANERLNGIFRSLESYLDTNFINGLIDKYHFDTRYKNDIVGLLKFIINTIKQNNSDREININILHEITDYFILKRREEYRSEYNVYTDLGISFERDEDSSINYLTDYLLKEDAKFILPGSDYRGGRFVTRENSTSLRKIVINTLVEQGMSKDLIIDVLDYLEDPNFELTNDKSLVLKNIKAVKKVAKEYVREHYKEILKYDRRYFDILYRAALNGKIKKTYIIDSKPFNILDFILGVRLDIVKDKLLDGDPLIYDSLVECMKKRKLHKLPEQMLRYLKGDKSILAYNSSSLVSFIEYYYKIYEREMKNSNISRGSDQCMSLPRILVNTLAFSSNLYVYSCILGEEDAKLIASNPGPNSANRKTSNNLRLNEAVEWTINNFKRDEVTVPPINTVFEYGDKKMRCVVGNFTHPSNVTHGERTGACMRIGGVGDTLFNFALENKNGFHLRFEDPETGEYISRVTGFRNGNTVFLNELRCSCNKDKYSDGDVVEFCRMISQEMIDLSKESKCPIDNVVVHRAYATQNLQNSVKLGVDNIKEGLPKFYSDIGSYVLIMATSNDDNSLVPINFDKSKVPTYQPAREQIICTNIFNNIFRTINRVHAIGLYLSKGSLTDVYDLDFKDGFVFGMANQDWYVYMDNNGLVHSEIIGNDKRALVEFEEAKNNILRVMNEYSSKEVSYGF